MEKAALLGDRDAGLSHRRSGSRRRRGAPVEGRDMDFRQRTAASLGAGSCWLSWVRLLLPFTIGYRGRVALRRKKAAPAVAISSTEIAGSLSQRVFFAFCVPADPAAIAAPAMTASGGSGRDSFCASLPLFLVL
nr:hypothetical protein Itr_chr05CG08340 [Ipomoea trifida]